MERPGKAIIDTDIHHTTPNIQAIYPYLKREVRDRVHPGAALCFAKCLPASRCEAVQRLGYPLCSFVRAGTVDPKMRTKSYEVTVETFGVSVEEGIVVVHV